MKHPGIYLHTEPADPESPLWMLHWSTLTLAKLVLTPDPVLMVSRRRPPPDAAIEAFGKVLEDMAPGMSEGLTMLSSDTPDVAPAEPLFMAPADSSIHGFAAYYPATGLAIGAIEGQGIIGPIWNGLPCDSRRRELAIHTLATFAYTEIRRMYKSISVLTGPTGLGHLPLLLEILQGSTYFPGLWIQSPDLNARTAQPATAG